MLERPEKCDGFCDSGLSFTVNHVVQIIALDVFEYDEDSSFGIRLVIVLVNEDESSVFPPDHNFVMNPPIKLAESGWFTQKFVNWP